MKYLALLRKTGVYLLPVSAIVFVHDNCLSDYTVATVDAIPNPTVSSASSIRARIATREAMFGVSEGSETANILVVGGRCEDKGNAPDGETIDELTRALHRAFTSRRCRDGEMIEGGERFRISGISDEKGNEVGLDALEKGSRFIAQVQGVGFIALVYHDGRYYVEPDMSMGGQVMQGVRQSLSSMYRGGKWLVGLMSDEEVAAKQQEEKEERLKGRQRPDLQFGSPRTWGNTAGKVIVWFVMIKLIIACVIGGMSYLSTEKRNSPNI